MASTETERSQRPSPAARDADLLQITRIVALAVLVGYLIAFIVQNSQSVTVDFLFFQTTSPLIWVIVVTAVIGALAARLTVAVIRRRKSRRPK